MKELNDFLVEKEGDKEQPHLKDEKEGSDDKKYIALMSEYKVARRHSDRQESNKILEKAMKLSDNGDVSRKAKLAAAYL
jgi:hypothetical protein